jgi:hypothetical protein
MRPCKATPPSRSITEPSPISSSAVSSCISSHSTFVRVTEVARFFLTALQSDEKPKTLEKNRHRGSSSGLAIAENTCRSDTATRDEVIRAFKTCKSGRVLSMHGKGDLITRKEDLVVHNASCLKAHTLQRSPQRRRTVVRDALSASARRSWIGPKL